ncbi:MAG: hypothetical protein R3D71_05285 [Rickettsiales bacterium]
MPAITKEPPEDWSYHDYFTANEGLSSLSGATISVANNYLSDEELSSNNTLREQSTQLLEILEEGIIEQSEGTQPLPTVVGSG